MLAVDMSNYTDVLMPTNLDALRSAGVGHVIVQAIDPPPGYPRGVTVQQVNACLAAGFTVDAYVWLWFGADLSDIHHKLSLLEGLAIRQLWLDVEDTAAVGFDAATCNARVAAALEACDAYRTNGGQPTGVYTGRWFWQDGRYMGNTPAFADRELWDANYDDVADARLGFVPYGGWSAARIKQYRGSVAVGGIGGLDLNVLSVAEEEELQAPPETPEPQPDEPDPCAGIVNSLGYIAGDLLRPVVKQKTKPSKALQRLIAGIRGEADNHGIGHG